MHEGPKQEIPQVYTQCGNCGKVFSKGQDPDCPDCGACDGHTTVYVTKFPKLCKLCLLNIEARNNNLQQDMTSFAVGFLVQWVSDGFDQGNEDMHGDLVEALTKKFEPQSQYGLESFYDGKDLDPNNVAHDAIEQVCKKLQELLK